MSYNAVNTVNLFREMASAWRFVHKRLSVLASYARNIQAAEQFIIRNHNCLPIFFASFSSIMAPLDTTIDPLFLNAPWKSLLFFGNALVNACFQHNINHNFPNSTLIFTYGSVSSASAGYSFFLKPLIFLLLVTYPILPQVLLLSVGQLFKHYIV